MSQNAPPSPPPAMVPWMIWFAILAGFLVIQFMIGGGLPSGEDKGEAPMGIVAVALGAVLISLVIRFFMLPRKSAPERQFPLMVVGLALAESCGLFGMFLVPDDYPQTKLILFMAAVVGIFLHAPVYMRERKAGSSYQR